MFCEGHPNAPREAEQANSDVENSTTRRREVKRPGRRVVMAIAPFVFWFMV